MAEPAAALPRTAGGRWGVYRQLLRAQVRAQASYRASFLFDLSGNALMPIIDLIAVLALFHVTRSLGGFGTFEVMVMYGLSNSAFSLADLAVGNIERIREYVRSGTFDAVLVRPLSTLGQLVALDFTIRRITRVAISVGVLVVALSRLPIEWTAARVVLVIGTPLVAALFFGSIFVITSTVAFFWIDSGELANAFTYGGRTFTLYPITVYSGWFRALFAYALGFGLVVYYPALALLGRSDPLGRPGWMAWTSPVVAAVSLALAAAAWRFGVRHYRSTGS